MNFDKIFNAPPTQLCMPYFYKSIKNSCQKSRIDYDRLFQSAVRNGDDYEQFIIDVNDEVNKNIAWILKVCSGGNHDAELELLNLNNGLDSIYSLMHNKQFVYKCNSNSTMEFLLNGMHEQDDAGYDFMQFFDDFEDSFYNFRLNNGYAGIYVHAIKTRYTFSSHKGDNLPAIAFSILTLKDNKLPCVLCQFVVVKGIYPNLLVDNKSTIMPCVAGEKCNNKVRLDVLLREEENEMPMSMQYCYLTPKKMCRCDCLGGAYAPYSILNLVAYVNEMYRHRNTLTRKNSKRAGSYKKHEVSAVVQGSKEHVVRIHDLVKYEQYDRTWKGGHHQSPVEHTRSAHERRIFNKDGTLKKVVMVKGSVVNKGKGKAIYEVKGS